MAATGSVGPYRIGERVGSSVWKAEDTRSGNSVAIKILTKQLPKEPAKREAFVRDVRVAAALYHASLIPMLEIVAAGDQLLMVMEFVAADPIPRRVKGAPLSRTDFFRLAYQLVDAVRFLHSKGITHANINADSVLVTPAGQVKLCGFNLMNVLARPDGPRAIYQHKANDARSVAYMAPEQITGQATDARVDIYSLGVVMYEMATGKLPYQGATAADLARAIVDGQPASPKSVNPSIDNAILAILGGCLFKDQYRRHKDAKLLLELIAKADPEAVKFAGALATRQPAPAVTAAPAVMRDSILLVADIADYESLSAADPDRASKALARMQLLLGEAVFLFDGQIADPFARKFVAELPNAESALEAARKGEFDVSPDQQGALQIPVRLLLHAGEVTTQNGDVVGEAVTRAEAALREIPPLRLHLTEDFVKKARGAVRVRDAGARAGMKLYTIQPGEIEPQLPPEPETPVEELEEQELVAPAPPRSRMPLFIAAGVAILLILGIGGFVLTRSKPAPPQPKAPVASPAPAPVAVNRKVSIGRIAVEGTDATLAARANAIRLATLEILRSARNITLTDEAAPDVSVYWATLRGGQPAPELVPGQAEAGSPVAVPDVASGIRSIIDWVRAQTGTEVRAMSSSAEALNAFADAVVAVAAKDHKKAEPAIVAATTADPDFLAAHMLAMRFYGDANKIPEAIAAGKRVVALDPTNVDVSRSLARMALSVGELNAAFSGYAAILRHNPGDIEALTHVARYAASVADGERFTKAMNRLSKVPAQLVPVHAPDLLVAAGNMEMAVDRYYDIEANVPNNAALSLKIGRIAVLRRSLPIAELELKKLEQSDREYGYHLLKAYIEATRRSQTAAEEELDRAAGASAPGDDFWTSAAEVYVILGQNDLVLQALEKAAARKEPTANYILTSPLFSYLRNEARYQSVRSALAAQQGEVRSALAQVTL